MTRGGKALARGTKRVGVPCTVTSPL